MICIIIAAAVLLAIKLAHGDVTGKWWHKPSNVVREVVGRCKKVVQHDTSLFVLNGVVVWCGSCIEVLVEERPVLLPPGTIRDRGEEPVPAHSGNASD